MCVHGFAPSPKPRKEHHTMTLRTDKKRPAGDSTHPAGSTDSAMLARTSRIIKAVIIYLLIAVSIASCMDAVRSSAVNCEEAFCDL